MSMDYYDKPEPEFAELLGKTIVAVEGAVADSERITFRCSDGSEYVMYHSQDCCERVCVESVTGDIEDLIGHPILRAEMVTSDKTPADVKHDYEPESQTWTFYKLATVRGWIDFRWFGSSNGYYSERVDFVRTEEPTVAQGADDQLRKAAQRALALLESIDYSESDQAYELRAALSKASS